MTEYSDIKKLGKIPDSDFYTRAVFDQVSQYAQDTFQEEPGRANYLYRILQERFQRAGSVRNDNIFELYQRVAHKLQLALVTLIPDEEFNHVVQEQFVSGSKRDEEFIIPLWLRIGNRMTLVFPYQREEVGLGIIKALKNNKEKIGTSEITLTKTNEKVPPYCKNWLADYDQSLGIEPQERLTIVQYINQNKNVALLKGEDRLILRRLILLYEYTKATILSIRIAKMPNAPTEEIAPQDAALLRAYYQRVAESATHGVKHSEQEPKIKPKPKKLSQPYQRSSRPSRNASSQSEKTVTDLREKERNKQPRITPPQIQKSARQPRASVHPQDAITKHAAEISLKIIRAEHLQQITEEQKKRLQLVIGQVLRGLKTREDTLATLASTLDNGGVGFGKDRAQRITGIISSLTPRLQGSPKKITQTPPIRPMSKPHISSQPAPPSNRFTLQSPKDISSLSMNFLRSGTDLKQSIKSVKEAAIEFSKESVHKSVDIIKFWKQSEPYHLYMEIGKQSMETKKSVGVLSRERKSAGKPYLTEEEFVAIADLSKDLQDL